MNISEKLKELSGLAGISGNEGMICHWIAKEFEKYCDEVTIDRFHNVFAVMRGNGRNRKKILCMAHMDEIGFLVKKIEENGFLRLSNIGGIDSKILPAGEVKIHGRKTILGIIGAKPPHLLTSEETKKAPQLEDLLVDTGYTKEQLAAIVSIGDPVTFAYHPTKLLGNKLASKSFDNRSGIAVLLQAAENLCKLKHQNDIVFVASVQEEVGLRGAMMAAFQIRPDAGVVVDVGLGEYPEGPKSDAYPLGKGPAIGVGPNLHKKLTKKMMDLAKEHNIPYQVDTEPGDTGTEAWAVQVTAEGIPTVLVSIPLRYMHTAVETLSVDDVKHSAALISMWASMTTKEMGECLCY